MHVGSELPHMVIMDGSVLSNTTFGNRFAGLPSLSPSGHLLDLELYHAEILLINAEPAPGSALHREECSKSVMLVPR